MSKLALVIGATGSFGGHAAAALLKHGWTVRAVARDPAAAQAKAGARMPIDWVKGDAMAPADVLAAAHGARIIVHAANPPGYRDWDTLVLPMFEATLAAARASGARVVLPGNVYNYAPDAGAMIGEDAPQQPATRKGAIRVTMEQRLHDAGVKGLILRAGDFFGPAAPNSALAWATVAAGGKVRAVLTPGRADHAFAYLPDLAETLARLVDREADLPRLARFHFRGHWLRRDDIADAIRRVTGAPKTPLLPFPWALVAALSPFVTTLRELREMRYLWDRPVGLDNAALTAFLGAEPHTPLDAAIAATLDDMGLLPAPKAAVGAVLAA